MAAAARPARPEPTPHRTKEDDRRTAGERRFWFTARDQFTARGQEPDSKASADDRPASRPGTPESAKSGQGEDSRGRSGALVSFGFGRRRDSGPQPPAIAGPSVPATLADTRRTDALPRFRRRAVAPEHESQMTPIERARADLLDAFSPGRPKAGVRDFSGRGTQIGEIIAAIEELGASVVLYGERGLGKTTLANTLSEIATDAGYVIARRPCDSETTYDSLMRSLLRGLSIRFASREIGDRMPPGSTFEALLPERDLRAADVTDALKRLSIVRVIFVVDEFDRSVDQRLRVQLAETIKILADERVPVHFVVIGVSETLHELVGVHPSLERNLTGVRMPLMSFDEIDAMIDRGEAITGMRYDRPARQRIAYLSCGTPYAAQLLCLYAGTHALSRESFDVGVQDVGFALHRTLNALDRSVMEAYDAATRGGKAEWLVDILFAAATAPADNFGRFDLNDASEAARQHEALPALPAIRLSRGLYELAKPGTCQVLARETTPTGEVRYRFTNQLMRLYTLARQAQARGLI